jgi:cytoskeletal protein RodZ
VRVKNSERGEDRLHQAHHHLQVHLLQNRRNANKKIKAKEKVKVKVDVIKNRNQRTRRVTLMAITMIILMIILMAVIMVMVVIVVNQALAQVNANREDKSINKRKMRSVYRRYVTKWYKSLEETVKITNNMFLKEWTKDFGESPSNTVLTRT